MTEKQRGVLAGISIAGALTFMGILGVLFASPEMLIPVEGLENRIGFVFRWDLAVVFWLLITIGTLARRRFFSPDDIDGGGLTTETDEAKIHQSILQNTLEQVVLALAVHTMGAVLLPIGWLGVIPVAAVMFSLGRILFWLGYGRGASARAVGFGLTFYPTILIFVLIVVNWVAGIL